MIFVVPMPQDIHKLRRENPRFALRLEAAAGHQLKMIRIAASPTIQFPQSYYCQSGGVESESAVSTVTVTAIPLAALHGAHPVPVIDTGMYRNSDRSGYCLTRTAAASGVTVPSMRNRMQFERLGLGMASSQCASGPRHHDSSSGRRSPLEGRLAAAVATTPVAASTGAPVTVQKGTSTVGFKLFQMSESSVGGPTS